MAIQTKTLAVLNDDVSGLNAIIDLLWDDARLRIESIRGTNPTSRAVALTARATADGTIFSTTFPAGATTTRNIPAGQLNRFSITIDGRGRLDGVEYSTAWVI